MQVETGAFEPGEVLGAERLDHAQPGEREGEAERAGEQGEQHALGKQLAHHARAAGAERDAQGDFPLAAGRARQQQVGHVGAGDHQQRRHGAQQRHERGAVVAHHLVLQREEVDGPSGVHPREGGFQAPCDGLHFGARLGEGNVGAEARERHQGARAGGAVNVGLLQDQRHPEIDLLLEEFEVRREHADDGPRRAAQLDGAADDGGVAAEAPPP